MDLSTKQAAAFLGIGPSLLRRHTNRGNIRATIVGRGYRFAMVDIETFILRRSLPRASKRESLKAAKAGSVRASMPNSPVRRTRPWQSL